MIAAFIRSWLGWLLLAPLLLRAIPDRRILVVVRRAVLFTVAWLAFALLNVLHWLGFLVDEILFRGYRRIAVTAPVVIVGIPRSGTTFLQRALATEPKFTTLTLLECVLAPSVSERYVWFGLRGLFQKFFPGEALRIEKMEAIHPVGVDEPEEDFLLLIWVHACFLASVLLTDSARFWRLARFDTAVPDAERRQVFEFYHRCLQKHLYFHGADKRLLSKNPSFTPMLGSLRVRYPDATIVGCIRPPNETVPSQLSSLMPAFSLLGEKSVPAAFSSRMVDALRHYYGDLAAFARSDEIYLVEMVRLNSDLESVVHEIFQRAGHRASDSFKSRLAELGTGGRNYASAHHYTAAEFGLTEEEIDRSFSEVWPLSLSRSHVQEH